MESAISYSCYVTTIYVGEALLKQTALLLPHVYEIFEEQLKEVTQKGGIDTAQLIISQLLG